MYHINEKTILFGLTILLQVQNNNDDYSYNMEDITYI